MREKQEIIIHIDVCFLMDCTGSMAPFIKAAKEKILEIILKVESIFNINNQMSNESK